MPCKCQALPSEERSFFTFGHAFASSILEQCSRSDVDGFLTDALQKQKSPKTVALRITFNIPQNKITSFLRLFYCAAPCFPEQICLAKDHAFGEGTFAVLVVKILESGKDPVHIPQMPAGRGVCMKYRFSPSILTQEEDCYPKRGLFNGNSARVFARE